MIYFILIVGLLTGCKAFSHSEGNTQRQLPVLEQARESLNADELYEARKQTRKILDKEPNDPRAQKLMAEIIDREIERQKEVFETKADDEFTPQEKDDAVKTWLERSQSLLEVRQYDQALLAAEKVFLYDPNNLKASQLTDKIKNQAYAEGKGESLMMRQVYEEEIQERVERYRTQAKAWMESGQWGAARLAVEKSLILLPEDREALKLYEKIQEHKRLKKQ